MTEIKWEEPPADGRGVRWDEIATQLRERPNDWALIAESYSPGLGTRINNGQGPWGPKGTFEARTTTASQTPLRQKVWARYVGDAA